MADAMASAEEVQLGVDGTAPLEEEEGPKLTPEQLAQAIQADARQRRLDGSASAPQSSAALSTETALQELSYVNPCTPPEPGENAQFAPDHKPN